MDKLKVAVIGVGHLGKAHVRVYSELPNVELVGVVDINEERGESIAEKYSTSYFSDAGDVIDRVDAVSIVTSTSTHFEIARKFLEHKVATIVEKPFVNTVEQADELIELGTKNGVPIQVGHIERFNPAVMAIKDYVKDPKYIESERISPYSFRSSDIGVVLDMMIHDIDIILHIVPSKLDRVEAIGVNVISKTEDIANARLEFENGSVASVKASRVSASKVRVIRIFSLDSYVSLNYQKNSAMIYKKSPGIEEKMAGLKNIDITKISDPRELLLGELLTVKHVDMAGHEPLKKELESFVDCVINKSTPIVTGEHGREAIRVADIICKKIDIKKKEILSKH